MPQETILEVVKKAIMATNSYNPETVLTETLRMGYDIRKANYVVEAIKTILTGKEYKSNKCKCTWHKPVLNPLNEYHIQYSRRWNEENRERKRKRYDELVKKGICPRCGRRPAMIGLKNCSVCLAKQREYEARRIRQRKVVM